eukprot:GHVQ01033824.1.p1 GENE.GHVQ01033824.1~~GHVQ01033824.1.p1  ORF type:complete len:624 (+),score=69.88 GHVQ01033824.1:308-2179(+)
MNLPVREMSGQTWSSKETINRRLAVPHIYLHPLVVLHLSQHYTRERLKASKILRNHPDSSQQTYTLVSEKEFYASHSSAGIVSVDSSCNPISNPTSTCHDDIVCLYGVLLGNKSTCREVAAGESANTPITNSQTFTNPGLPLLHVRTCFEAPVKQTQAISLEHSGKQTEDSNIMCASEQRPVYIRLRGIGEEDKEVRCWRHWGQDGGVDISLVCRRWEHMRVVMEGCDLLGLYFVGNRLPWRDVSLVADQLSRIANTDSLLFIHLNPEKLDGQNTDGGGGRLLLKSNTPPNRFGRHSEQRQTSREANTTETKYWSATPASSWPHCESAISRLPQLTEQVHPLPLSVYSLIRHATTTETPRPPPSVDMTGSTEQTHPTNAQQIREGIPSQLSGGGDMYRDDVISERRLWGTMSDGTRDGARGTDSASDEERKEKLDGVNGKEEVVFDVVRERFSVQAEDSERIALTHVSDYSARQGLSSHYRAHLHRLTTAIHSLQARLRLLICYVEESLSGDLPWKPRILREVTLIARRLKAVYDADVSTRLSSYSDSVEINASMSAVLRTATELQVLPSDAVTTYACHTFIARGSVASVAVPPSLFLCHAQGCLPCSTRAIHGSDLAILSAV